MKNYYAILEVERDVGPDDIKKSYRALALKHHPDRNAGDPDAAERFKEITEAYGVLMDPAKRREYDQVFSYARTQSDFDGARFDYSQEEIFRDLFNNPLLYNFLNEMGRDFNKRGVQFGPSFFEKLFFSQGGMFVAGAVFRAFSPLNKAYRVYDLFKMAHTAHTAYKQYTEAGEGRSAESAGKKFGVASLKGKIKGLFEKKRAVSEDGSVVFRVTVSFKEATCGVQRDMAFNLVGNEEKISVKIPPGVESGTKLRLKGKGNYAGDGDERGDLFLIIEVE